MFAAVIEPTSFKSFETETVVAFNPTTPFKDVKFASSPSCNDREHLLYPVPALISNL